MISLQFISHFPFITFHLPLITGLGTSAGPALVTNGKWEMIGKPFWLVAFVIAAILFVVSFANGQTPTGTPGDPTARVIDGVNNGTVFGMGQSIRITGTVKEGAIAFGGDVIVEGTVEGDVASIGGSVVQRKGSRIGGDVIVIGGAYHHDQTEQSRDPKSVTIMYAGYEEQLKQVMREPFTLISPKFSAAFIGIRVLAILFWYLIAVALTAAMPNTVSRAVTRLQLTSLRVALIGLLGSIAITVGVFLCLLILPSVVGAIVALLATLLVIVATLFGRAVISAATGRWLQKRFLPKLKSESVTLLLGVTFWVVMASLPYVWPIVVAGLLVVSLGLALTARYRLSWKKSESAKV